MRTLIQKNALYNNFPKRSKTPALKNQLEYLQERLRAATVSSKESITVPCRHRTYIECT